MKLANQRDLFIDVYKQYIYSGDRTLYFAVRFIYVWNGLTLTAVDRADRTVRQIDLSMFLLCH